MITYTTTVQTGVKYQLPKPIGV